MGITSLEIAIILITFVVISAVFSYAVLSAGVFASDKNREAIHDGLQSIQQTLNLKGSIVASKGSIDTTGDRVGDTEGTARLSFKLSNTLQGEGIDLTPSYIQHPTQNKLQHNSTTNSIIINLTTSVVTIPDCAWTAYFIGKNDGDSLLEYNETISITVWLTDYNYHPSVRNYYELGIDEDDPFMDNVSDLLQSEDKFSLQIVSSNGATLTIERTLPPHLESVMDLK